MTDLTRIPFHGTDIIVDDEHRVALRPVCETLGLDYSGQLQRVKRQPWACVGVIPTQLPGDTQRREVAFVDRQTFTMWLATIDTSRVKDPVARDLIVTYQREAAQALDRYFNEGGAINLRASEHQLNAIVRRAQMEMELCQAAKGLIHPDHLEAKARIILAQGMGEAPELNPETLPLYTQDYLRGHNLSSKQMASTAGMFGKRVKAAFTLEHGVEPKKRPMNLPNGQIREVYAYTEADRPLMDSVWTRFYAGEVA
jgi:hypothetical protein